MPKWNANGGQKAFNMGSSGTQYDAMVTELLSLYCGAHLVESYCKESNISDTNSLRYCLSSYLNKIWLSVRRHHVVYLFMFQNGLDRKDAIFVIVPL